MSSEEEAVEKNSPVMENQTNDFHEGNNSTQNSENICRICHGGDEEGRLFSPCRCKGSMKYVHIQCLNSWRISSANSSSYFQCDTCHYKYHFQRTSISKLFSSFIVLQITTFLVFLLLIIFAGYLWKIVEFFALEEPDNDRSFLSLLCIDLYHLLSGAILVGLVGFLQLVFFMHIGPFYGLGRGGKSTIELVILGVIISIGLIKAFVGLYGIVKKQTQKILLKVEDIILEVKEE